MKTKTTLIAAGFIAAALAVSAADAPAPPHVTEVIVLDVGANMQKFMDLASRANAIMKQLQIGNTVRYYVATWAGPEAGHVIVTVEYPSLSAMAQSIGKLNASPEFRQWQADAQSSGLKELSSSVVTELHF